MTTTFLVAEQTSTLSNIYIDDVYLESIEGAPQTTSIPCTEHIFVLPASAGSPFEVAVRDVGSRCNGDVLIATSLC